MMVGLRVAGVNIRRGGRNIVADAKFSAPSGKVTGLVGPNGAGKSTLISAIVGIERPEAGDLTFEGANLVGMGRRERAGTCAYVEQSASTEENPDEPQSDEAAVDNDEDSDDAGDQTPPDDDKPKKEK